MLQFGLQGKAAVQALPTAWPSPLSLPLGLFHHACQFCQGELPENIPRGEKEPSLARLAD